MFKLLTTKVRLFSDIPMPIVRSISILRIFVFLVLWFNQLYIKRLSLKQVPENRFFSSALPYGCKETILARLVLI